MGIVTCNEKIQHLQGELRKCKLEDELLIVALNDYITANKNLRVIKVGVELQCCSTKFSKGRTGSSKVAPTLNDEGRNFENDRGRNWIWMK